MTMQAKNGVYKKILAQLEEALEVSSSRTVVRSEEDNTKKAAVRYYTSGTRVANVEQLFKDNR